MMYGLKPFNGAEMRAYLDVLNEAPPAYNPKGVPLPTAPTATPPGQDLGDQIIKKGGAAAIDAVASVGPGFKKASQDLTPGSPYYQKNIANNPALVKQAADVTSKMTPDQFDASVADTKQRFDKAIAPNQDLGRSATSPEYDNIADKVGLPPVQEDELSELRRYFDMVEANETPTGAGQFSTKQMGDGTKVSFDPVTGGKTVYNADGATSYNVAGQKTSSQTPSIKGFQQSTNYQTGEKTTTGQVGPVGISATQRPDQSTVTTAEVPLGADVTAKVARGIGFGGAGKDVQQGGNQVTGITTRTAQNPEGTTSSFVGKPTDQQFDQAMQAVQEDDLDDKVMAQHNTPQAKAKSQAIDKAFASGDQKEFDRLGIQSPERIERDLQTMRAGEKAQDAALQEDFPGTHGAWMHGGFKVTYDPTSQTVRVQGKNQDRSHKFTNAPTNRSYHDRVQQIIDRLEDESELRENPSLVMREWMALCR